MGAGQDQEGQEMKNSSNPNTRDYRCVSNGNFHNIGAGGLIWGHAAYAPNGRSWSDKHASKRLIAIATRHCRAAGIPHGSHSFRDVEGRLNV